MILGKIDVTKVLKEHLFISPKGAKYLDVAFIENRDGRDQYGNDGFIVQSLNKEARARGEKGPIIGNWRNKDAGQKPNPEAAAPAKAADDTDDVPF